MTDQGKQLQSNAGEQLRRLQDIVKQTMEDEKLIVNNLLNPPKEMLSPGEKISDKVAMFGGSWRFIIAFFTVLICWIIYNSMVPQSNVFDPYPFILMNLILSCLAAIQAPIIMMSQNRQEEKDRKRSENDYLVNMKAELEIRSLHKKIDLLLEEQMKIMIDSQAKQLQMLEAITDRLERRLDH